MSSPQSADHMNWSLPPLAPEVEGHGSYFNVAIN